MHSCDSRRVGASPSSPREDVCQICLEQLQRSEAVRLACGHAFHGLGCLAAHIKFQCQATEERVQTQLREQFAALGPVLQQLGGGNFTNMRQRGQFRQCPDCGYGPVLNTNCANMDTHDSTRGSGTGRTTNSCPLCGFHSQLWSDWSLWEPENICAAARCPICRGSCQLAQGEEVCVQQRFEADYHCHRVKPLLGRALRYLLNALQELQELRRRHFAAPNSSTPQVPATNLATPALLQPHEAQRPADNFDAFLDLSNRPQAAIMSRLPQLKELLQRRRRAAWAAGRPLVLLETEIAEAPRESKRRKLATAMSEVCKLNPAEQEYWSLINATLPDFQLCMARSEKLIDDLNAAIRPVALHNTPLMERLGRTLKWRSNTFVDIPSLDSLFLELRLELEKLKTVEASVQTEAGDECGGMCVMSVEAEILENGRQWSEQAASEEAPRDSFNRCRELALLLWPVKDRLPEKTAKLLGRPWQDNSRLSPVQDRHGHHQVAIPSGGEWTEARAWRELEFLELLCREALDFDLDVSDRAELMAAMERMRKLRRSCKGHRSVAQLQLGNIDFVTCLVLALAKFLQIYATPTTSFPV